MARFEMVAQVSRRIDLVSVAPTFAMAPDETAFFQVGDDAEHSTLRDADLCGDVAKSRGRITREAKQDVGVIAQEGPRGTRRQFPCCIRSPDRHREVHP
jgi:hypothetical protein